jgi:Domain of unknown function (DUF4404)
MDNKNSRKLLQQLHDEINNTQAVDEQGSEMLRDLEGDIRALLERSEENPVELHPSIVQRLQGALNHFETTHPDLTMLISKLLDSLSNAGI